MAATKKTAKATKAKKSEPPVTVHGFKGFTKDLKCRDKQYALGETFEEAEASLCHHGLHFCEHPLDCLNYYSPGQGSRYAEVVAESPIASKLLDSRAHAVMLDARRKPECAQSARNFLALAVRHAERCGQAWLAEKCKGYQQSILGL